MDSSSSSSGVARGTALMKKEKKNNAQVPT